MCRANCNGSAVATPLGTTLADITHSPEDEENNNPRAPSVSSSNTKNERRTSTKNDAVRSIDTKEGALTSSLSVSPVASLHPHAHLQPTLPPSGLVVTHTVRQRVLVAAAAPVFECRLG